MTVFTHSASIELVKDRDQKVVAVRWRLFEAEDDGFRSVKDIKEIDVPTSRSVAWIAKVFLDGDEIDPSKLTLPASVQVSTRVRTTAGRVRACLAQVLAST